eukprot:3913378-Pleurochrysis_carterae.AAC.4
MGLNCVWKAEKKREGTQNGSNRVGEEARLAHQGEPMDEMSSVAREAAENLRDEWGDHVPASQRVLVWNVGGEPTMEESKRGSVFAKAKVAPRVGRGAQPVGMGLTILSLKSSWCCVAVVLCTTQSGHEIKASCRRSEWRGMASAWH